MYKPNEIDHRKQKQLYLMKNAFNKSLPMFQIGEKGKKLDQMAVLIKTQQRECRLQEKKKKKRTIVATKVIPKKRLTRTIRSNDFRAHTLDKIMHNDDVHTDTWIRARRSVTNLITNDNARFQLQYTHIHLGYIGMKGKRLENQ